MINSQISPREKQEYLKTAAIKRLINFAEVVDKKYYANWHHEVIAEALERALDSVINKKKTRIIIEVPPRHGKSDLASIKFPAWAMGKYPWLEFIIASYSSELAIEFGMKARDTMNSQEYKAIFNTRLKEDTKAKGRWMTKEKGGYTATGIGGSITGKGFHIGLIDDPFKNREEADSELQRRKVWDWYLSTFYTRQEGNGAIIVINQRWHKDDLVGILEKQEEEAVKMGLTNYDEWEYITFPAIAEEHEEFRKKGEALWPEKFNIENLENIRNTLGTYEFSSLYQQKPVASEHQEFTREWFKYFEINQIRDLPLQFYTTIDPGGKEKESDPSVVLTVAKSRTSPNWYRIEETAGLFDPGELIDAVFMHRERYKSDIWLETIAYQKSLKFFIQERQRKENQYFIVHELKNNKKKAKVIRIRGLIPLYQAGVIYHLKNEDQAYERELLDFPFGRKDDRIDAMASMLEAIKTPTEYDDLEFPHQEPIVDPY